MEQIDECIMQQAEHFLDVTKFIFKQRGFCFSTAFIIGNQTEIIKLDLSSDEKKDLYSKLIKRRFRETHASHLIVIQESWVYQLTPDQLQEVSIDPHPDCLRQENGVEALVVYISSPQNGEVWQVPFTRDHEGIRFEGKEVLKTIVSENWMINRNKHLVTELN